MEALSAYSALISYIALPGEIDPLEALNSFDLPSSVFMAPQDIHSDPFAFATLCKDTYPNKKVCILIPGQAFDIFGTRHGRGNGWYDRFLSAVPPDWLRIGITDKEHLSPVRLHRKEWDQPVDQLIVFDSLTSSSEVYETLARPQ